MHDYRFENITSRIENNFQLTVENMSSSSTGILFPLRSITCKVAMRVWRNSCCSLQSHLCGRLYASRNLSQVSASNKCQFTETILNRSYLLIHSTVSFPFFQMHTQVWGGKGLQSDILCGAMFVLGRRRMRGADYVSILR